MKQISDNLSRFRQNRHALHVTMTLMASVLFAATANATTSSIPEDYRVEPAPGSTVEAIDRITVINKEGDEISNSGNTILINDVEYATITTTDYNRVIFELETPVTASGEYEIVIPEGRINDGWFGTDEFRFSLNIAGNNPGDEPGLTQTIIPDGFTLSPAPGSEVETLKDLKLTYYDDWTDLTLVNKVIMINGEEVAINGYGDFGELTITLINQITEAGEYSIVIPVGTFRLDSLDDNELFSFSITVTGTGNPDTPGDDDDDDNMGELAGIPADFSVTPGENANIDELSVIRIVDDYYGYIRVSENARLYIDGKSVSFTTEVGGDDDNTLTITLDTPVTEEGEHTIQMPEGFFRYMIYNSEEFGWSVVIGNGSDDNPEPGQTIVPEGVTINPEPGSKIESLTSLSVAVDDMEELYCKNDNIFVNYAKTSISPKYGNPIELTLTDPKTESGIYWITIPANTIMDSYGTYLENPIQFWIEVDTTVGLNQTPETMNETIEIMTIDGIRVDHMVKGNLYIVRNGSKISKHLAR